MHLFLEGINTIIGIHNTKHMNLKLPPLHSQINISISTMKTSRHELSIEQMNKYCKQFWFYTIIRLAEIRHVILPTKSTQDISFPVCVCAIWFECHNNYKLYNALIIKFIDINWYVRLDIISAHLAHEQFNVKIF